MLEWKSIETAPENVLVMLGHRGTRWVASGYVFHNEDEGRIPENFATIVHYNGREFLRGFLATHWAPLPNSPE